MWHGDVHAHVTCHTSHAHVRIHLHTHTRQVAPEWVTDLLTSGYLREVPKFSKFVHGTSYLNQHGRRPVTELPYWCAALRA